MEEHKGTKLHIEKIVHEYARDNAEEVIAFREHMKQTRDRLKNGLAEFKGATFLERAIAEFPETLESLLKAELADADYEFFSSKEGMRWFVKKFPLFATPDRV